jgi:hypothetical protein
MFVDPSGEFIITAIITGMIVGAVLGMAIDITVQGAGNDWSWDGIDWNRVMISGAVGTVTGGVGGALVGPVASAGVGVGRATATSVGNTVAPALGPAIHRTWQAAEAATRTAFNAVKHTFNTPMGNRVVDGFNRTTRTIHEVKYGQQSLTQAIQSQIAKDAWLLNNHHDITQVIWHFHRSAQTGLGGPSGPLLQALIDAGFKVMLH